MPTRTPLPDDFNELVQLYEEGASAASLARKAGVGRIVFNRWLREAGIPTRGHSRQGRHRHTSRKGGKSRTYRTWEKMKNRCLNPKNKAFENYGGRGITVCDRWLVFDNFLEDMGERPAKMEIDRIDNDGNYEPGNCRWVTPAQNMRNTRRNIDITFRGRTMCRKDWAAEIGIDQNTIGWRLGQGWSVEKTLTTPAGETRERRITHDGETLCLAEWARRLGVSYMMLLHRHRRGWPDREVLFGRRT